MSQSSAAHDLEETAVSPSPFRAAFGRARFEALSATGAVLDQLGTDVAPERAEFEYRLLKRRGRSADEAAWNALGRKGWELVGVTGKHAAFKRRVSR